MKQGDVIGKAGNNVYQSTLKKHLHFIVSIDDKTVNPDKYFNQKIEKIKKLGRSVKFINDSWRKRETSGKCKRIISKIWYAILQIDGILFKIGWIAVAISGGNHGRDKEKDYFNWR